MKKLLLIPILFLTLTFTLVMAEAKAIVIDVPYSWTYTFTGNCALGCGSHDINGNPIASQGAGFELFLQNGIFGIPHIVDGYDLTNGGFTFLESNRAGFVESDVTTNRNSFTRGRISGSDAVVDGPGFFGEAGGPNVPVDIFGNVATGVYGADSFLASGPAFVEYDFSTVAGFATTFNVKYLFINEESNRVPVVDQNTSFYTPDNIPFWQGIGEWKVEVRDSIATRIDDPVSVPEPSTMFLLGLGLLGLIGTKRKA